ncbi:MAG: glycosyltransferase family 25 protein [Rhodoferax sp.]
MKHEINTFFGQVHVINLRSRADRRAEMLAQLNHIGLGFDSHQLTLFEASKPLDKAGFPTLGARGCFMSHLDVLRHALDDKASSVLILEDDLNFCEDFRSKFNAVADALERHDWGMFYGVYMLEDPIANSGAAVTRVDPQRPIVTTAFVAVNGQHIAALVDYLDAMLQRAPGDPQGGAMHIDGAYGWFRQSHPEVSTWLATPALGFQRSSRTDVHALRWYDRGVGSAWLASLLRRWRNRMRR